MNPSHRKIPTLFLVLLLLASIAILDLLRLSLSGAFEKKEIEVVVLYSSEKSGWLEAVTPQFLTEWEQNGSKPLKLTLLPIGSGKGTMQIGKGSAQPTVWSPASRFWLTVLNHLWREEHDFDIVNPADPSLVVSPTVIAIWESYLKVHNVTSLHDLRQLAISDPSFTFAHTNPQSSNSGYGAVIMEAAAAANKPPEALTLSDLENETVQAWMKDLESAAIQYGSSTGFLGKLMVSRGPEVLKAAMMYENLVIEGNAKIGDMWDGDKLVAVYPSEGTVLNDHPFSILNAPWVSPEQRNAAATYLRFLLRKDIQEKALEYGFRTAIPIDPQLEASVFTPEVGVTPTLDNISIYSIAKMDGQVLNRIPDLWLATRAFDDSGSSSSDIFPLWDVLWGTTATTTALLVLFTLVLSVKTKLETRKRRYHLD